MRLFHTVENHVILNVQHGEVDVDDLADYVKIGSREPYNAIRAIFDNENFILAFERSLPDQTTKMRSPPGLKCRSVTQRALEGVISRLVAHHGEHGDSDVKALTKVNRADIAFLQLN